MVEQIEQHLRPRNHQNDSRRSGRFEKLWLHRRERRRAKKEPDCQPGYRHFRGWEY